MNKRGGSGSVRGSGGGGGGVTQKKVCCCGTHGQRVAQVDEWVKGTRAGKMVWEAGKKCGGVI